MMDSNFRQSVRGTFSHILISTSQTIEYVDCVWLFQNISPEAHARILRQHNKQTADNMLVGTVLARYMLLRGFGIPFGKQRFAYGPHGKPFLPDYPDVHFNISHSGQRVLCAVADRPVGVDIEQIRPLSPEMLQYARRHGYTGNAGEDFFRWWTQLEAMGKCVGVGIDWHLRPEDFHIQQSVDPSGEYILCVATQKET